MNYIDQDDSLSQTKVSYMENCLSSTSKLFFLISSVMLGQRNFRRERKLCFLKNQTFRFGVFKKPLGDYAVKQRVMILNNKTEAKIVNDDVTMKTRIIT